MWLTILVKILSFIFPLVEKDVWPMVNEILQAIINWLSSHNAIAQSDAAERMRDHVNLLIKSKVESANGFRP